MRGPGTITALLIASVLGAVVGAVGVPAGTAAAPRICTIVGTAKADVLVGTPGRDVICGLGGADRLIGRGGGDVLIGGPGDDVLIGGRGQDDLRGGPGDDVLLGGPGWDLLRGGTGDDVLRGGGGNDRLAGGPGGDVLRGGGGNDQLFGGPGDDDLHGGRGSDRLSGGPGRDRCPPDVTDWQTCFVDRVPPTLVSLTTSVTRLDVTSTSRSVTLRAHLRDDLTVQGSWAPYLYLYNPVVTGASTGTNELKLVSGTVRDGVWTTTVTVPRGFPATHLNVELYARDRGGQMIRYRREAAVEVVNERPDTELPTVTALAPVAGATVDTRRTGTITARARIVDADTGVGPPPVFCLPRPQRPDATYQAQSCMRATLVAGTRRDGTWQAVLRAPTRRGFASGEACLSISATDAARPWSEDLSRLHTCEPIAARYGSSVLAALERPFTIRGS